MSDPVTLHLVVDTSGSMSEGGKHLIARGVVRATEQYVRLGYGSADLVLVAWSGDARVVEWSPNEEYPAEMLVCEGAANAKALVDLLEGKAEGQILLITDGFWSRNDAKVLKQWKEHLQQDVIRIIKIGADANRRLKGADVFAIEDLFACLHGWLDGGVA